MLLNLPNHGRDDEIYVLQAPPRFITLKLSGLIADPAGEASEVAGSPRKTASVQER